MRFVLFMLGIKMSDKMNDGNIETGYITISNPGIITGSTSISASYVKNAFTELSETICSDILSLKELVNNNQLNVLAHIEEYENNKVINLNAISEIKDELKKRTDLINLTLNQSLNLIQLMRHAILENEKLINDLPYYRFIKLCKKIRIQLNKFCNIF